MARVITNEFQKYFVDLTATNEICSALGTTLTFGTNLFVDHEPGVATQCVTIYAYGGSSPNVDSQRQNPSVQVRVRANSIQKAVETSQSMINVLHFNQNVCASGNGQVYAIQSAPITLGYTEGGEWAITTTNYRVKHIKLS